MGEAKAKRMLVIAGIWVGLAIFAAIAWKTFFKPKADDELEKETSSDSQYAHTVKLAADSFSGYAVLRSETMGGLLKKEAIRLDVVDDGADYDARLKSLKKGDTQMAVFTIDSLITAGAKMKDFPASIVMVIDETRGADAIVAYKSDFASVQDLDGGDVRLVLTPNSPSEFLARVVLAHFQLPSLPEKWWVAADGAEAVHRKLKSARGSRRAFVLWEPYVSKALEDPQVHVLLDSSRLEGYIVDVLVARRSFLQKKPEVVKSVVESYLRASFLTRQKTDGLVKLVAGDAKDLSDAQARKLVDGVHWKNTLENYAHFGVVPAEQRQGVQHLEDMIRNITEVLLKTGALREDPLKGQASKLFYDGVLRALHGADFHPGKKVNVVKGLGGGSDKLAAARKGKKLRALSDAEWKELLPVGNLRAEPISFSRGGARLTIQGRRDLEALAAHLKSWPNYYVKVVGHARAEGDAGANLRLAWSRAEAAAAHIASQGIAKDRLRAEGARPSAGGGDAQAVSFLVGEANY